MRIRKECFPLFIFFGLMIFAGPLSAGQSSETERLRARVTELERRVAKLEVLIGTSTSNKIQYSEKWRNRALWRRFRTKMAMRQVESLLGRPKKIDGGAFTDWLYEGSLGSASIRFYEGLVDSWNEPD